MLSVNSNPILLSSTLLKPGKIVPALFVAPGISGDPTELAAIVEKMQTQNAIYGLKTAILTGNPTRPDTMICSDSRCENSSLAQPIDVAHIGLEAAEITVERLGHLYARAIVNAQASGPYALAGYSFGGLVMLEAARFLHTKGESVVLLFLLDTFLHERQWLWKSWIKLLCRRTIEHAFALTRMPPNKAIQRVSTLSAHLADHFRSRGGHTRKHRPRAIPIKASDAPPFRNEEFRLEDLQELAYARYRPCYYPGKITLLRAANEPRIPKDVTDFWRRFVREIEIHEVFGDHEQLLSVHAKLVAATLQNCFQAALP